MTVLGVAPAHAATVACPDSVRTDQEFSQSYGEWQSFPSSMPSYLQDYRMFDGPPTEQAELKPDTADTGVGYTEWTFDPTQPQKLWVVCEYSNTQLMLMRALPVQKVKSCRVDYDKETHAPKPMECQ